MNRVSFSDAFLQLSECHLLPAMALTTRSQYKEAELHGKAMNSRNFFLPIQSRGSCPISQRKAGLSVSSWVWSVAPHSHCFWITFATCPVLPFHYSAVEGIKLKQNHAWKRITLLWDGCFVHLWFPSPKSTLLPYSTIFQCRDPQVPASTEVVGTWCGEKLHRSRRVWTASSIPTWLPTCFLCRCPRKCPVGKVWASVRNDNPYVNYRWI